MFDAYSTNDLWMSMMSTLAGDDVDLEPAEKAFRATSGDFRAKFAAAVHARLVQLVVPEVFVELPEHPDQLRKSDLDKLVRPASDGFLSSYANKDELLHQVNRIRRRQEQRPAWIPRIDPNGDPIAPPDADSIDTGREPDRPLMVAALTEIGEVTVLLPEAGQERAELPMAPGGIGEWESALYSVLGLVGEHAAARTVTIDAGPEYTDHVLELATMTLSGAGWIELEESTWEGRMEQSLLRRGEHCLLVKYDPVTRQVQTFDGKPELELTLQMLAEDGVLIVENKREILDTSQAAAQQWDAALLAAAEDLLNGRIDNFPQLDSPVQITMLGLHPHAEGALRGPQATTLVEHQLDALFGVNGMLTPHN